MRHEGRQAALQLLYELDVQGFEEVDVRLRDLVVHLLPELPVEARGFAEELCREVASRLEEIDRTIEAASSNWRVERMSRVDRSVLRLAVGELGSEGAPPAKVVLNEAIELAKEFGTAESAAFVNGVLNRVVQERGG